MGIRPQGNRRYCPRGGDPILFTLVAIPTCYEILDETREKVLHEETP